LTLIGTTSDALLDYCSKDEERMVALLESPFYTYAVDKADESEEYEHFIWERVSFLHPAYEGKWEAVEMSEIQELSKLLLPKDLPKGAHWNEAEGVYFVGNKLYIPRELRTRL